MSGRLKKLNDWYEEEGRSFFKNYTNKMSFVEKNYKTKSTKEVSGVYIIRFNNIPIYVGESDQLGIRFREHMYNLKKDGKSYWGIEVLEVENRNIKLTIDILEDNILEEADREN